MRLWTDGSYRYTTRCGGWAVYVPAEDLRLSGGSSVTTNNRMELMAIIEGLTLVKRRRVRRATIYSDSTWAINVTTGQWRAKVNLDMVTVARDLYRGFLDRGDIVRILWVHGHRYDENNITADRLARNATDRQEMMLRDDESE